MKFSDRLAASKSEQPVKSFMVPDSSRIEQDLSHLDLDGWIINNESADLYLGSNGVPRCIVRLRPKQESYVLEWRMFFDVNAPMAHLATLPAAEWTTERLVSQVAAVM